MENMKPNETAEFLWRRLAEECPPWAIGVPVLFGLIVVALIVWFRAEGRLKSALVGGVIVGALSAVYLPMAFILRPFFSWMVILIPVMTVALFYVGLMYLRDAKSVHLVWAVFLGLIRCCVYVCLAVVFMLPGCQHYEKQEYESKVIILFDVSGSMFSKDDLPEIGQDPATLPTRQDKIVNFLLAKQGQEASFLERIVQKSPVTMYRFGGVLDDSDIVSLNAKKDKTIDDERIRKWLKPDAKDYPRPNVEGLKEEDVKEKLAQHAKRLDLIDSLKGGTNIGGACLSVHKIENSSFIQAIIVLSDGQSNLGSDDARSEFLARVGNPKRPIPVLTLGVGQFRLPANIRIDDVLAPEETRPDDKFSVRVPVVGTGLHDKEFNLTLEITRVKDVTGAPVQEAPHILGPKPGKFKGAGDHPQDVVEFEIDVQELKKIKAADDRTGELEGEWQIVAIVPRHPDEPFPDAFHKTDPIKVQVQKRALRVLLFAGGATREYQFLRTILYREMTEKRMEMCICLQTGKEDHIDQDVEPDRMLADFPNKLGPDDPGAKFMSLNDYDVIIAFDPDWSKLSAKQLNLLEEWVGTHAGGIIFVAGPVFTYQLARPGGRDINSLLKLYPVVPKDSRLHGLNLPGNALSHDSTRPYTLHFPASARQFEFLKLDEEGESPTAGWDGFFWNRDKVDPQEVRDMKPRRGIFSYYPVERLKPNSAVVATFGGPKESRINGGKDEQPFIVSMLFGQGKTLYLGSGEFWRLRAYKDGYQDRLWIKMARYVSSGSTQQKKYGRILLARNLPVGVVNFEAQVKGKDLLPLPRDLRPTVLVKRIDKNKDEKAEMQKFDLQPKPSDAEWQGYFVGNITIKEPGEYEFQLPIPNSTEMLRQSLIVRKPNPELDNVRTNFGYLYQLASDARDLLKNLPPETRKEIEPLLQIPQDQSQGATEKAGKRLFFPLQSADAISKCLVPVPPKTEIIKGRFEDLWDGGVKTERVVSAFWATLLAPLAVGVIGVVILVLLRQFLNALVFFGICLLMSIGVGVLDYVFINYMADELPVHFSYLLMIVVGFLGIEWLARKLLRLA